MCRRCLKSYTSENMLMRQKPKKKENYDITTIRTSSDSHLHWKDHFPKNRLYFGVYAGFEADSEFNNSSLGIETTNIQKQHPVVNGFNIVSETYDALKSDCYESPLEETTRD